MADITITPTTVVDDSGTTTDGTVWNAVFQALLETHINTALAAVQAAAGPSAICQGRLTLTTLTPVTTADVLAATAVKWTPYKGASIGLYDGATKWQLLPFAELSLSIAGLAASTPFDVFAFNNSGVVALESLAWTNDTTRATALVLQDGVLVKSGATTRRYLGSFRTTTTIGQTEESFAKRYVSNYYNRVRRPLRVRDTTDTWPYTLAAYRQANGNAANQLEVMVGFGDAALEVFVHGQASSTTTAVNAIVAIGEDSTTTMVTGCLTSFCGSGLANTQLGPTASYRGYPAPGRHFYAWLELSTASGTTTWLGDNGNVIEQSGIHGWIEG